MALSLSVEEGAMAVYVGGQYSRHQVAPAIYLRCQPMRTSPLAAGKAPTSSPLLSPLPLSSSHLLGLLFSQPLRVLSFPRGSIRELANLAKTTTSSAALSRFTCLSTPKDTQNTIAGY
ncbi:hypothetical protein V2G26_020691 [Clonostachys chloroleuca]